MSHPINDEVMMKVADEVCSMPVLDMLNLCDDLGIKTDGVSCDQLMEDLEYALYEQRMQI